MKNNTSEFMEIKDLGCLKFDKILFESYYPILFTCKNEKEQLFLCSCCQKNKKGTKWLITETKPEIIIKILTDKITLRNGFLSNKNSQITVFINSSSEKVINKNDPIDWDEEISIYLPDKDEYMDVEDGEFKEEIEYYNNLVKNDEFKYSNENLTYKVNTIYIHKQSNNSNNLYHSDFEIVLKEFSKDNVKPLKNKSSNYSLCTDEVDMADTLDSESLSSLHAA